MFKWISWFFNGTKEEVVAVNKPRKKRKVLTSYKKRLVAESYINGFKNQRELAELYHVSQSTVSKIVKEYKNEQIWVIRYGIGTVYP